MAIKELRDNTIIIKKKADKGGGTVIIRIITLKKQLKYWGMRNITGFLVRMPSWSSRKKFTPLISEANEVGYYKAGNGFSDER